MFVGNFILGMPLAHGLRMAAPGDFWEPSLLYLARARGPIFESGTQDLCGLVN
jgi:hypothetical protein